MKKITKVAELISAVRTAKCGGQFATIVCETTPKFNVFPNADYCTANGITLASGKGSKALNEPYRFGGEDFRYRFSLQFHFDQDYKKTLERKGGSLSEDGGNTPKDFFGSIAVGHPSTYNVCLRYMDANYFVDGYYLDGRKIEDTETLDYIKGYKSVRTSQSLVEYREIGVRNVRSLSFGGETYEVAISDITPKEYDALCVAFDATHYEPKDKTDKGFNIAL